MWLRQLSYAIKTKAPKAVLGTFLAFRCVSMAEGWLPSAERIYYRFYNKSFPYLPTSLIVSYSKFLPYRVSL